MWRYDIKPYGNVLIILLIIFVGMKMGGVELQKPSKSVVFRGYKSRAFYFSSTSSEMAKLLDDPHFFFQDCDRPRGANAVRDR